MLCLQSDTNPEWLPVAIANLDTLLIDHAHCEKKASLNAFNMISRYPERSELVREMILLIEEETQHLKHVVAELHNRGIELTRDKGSIYAQQLSAKIRKQEPERMLDMLLVDALIEARSCERFSLLAKCEQLPPDVRIFYHNLLASEAGHYRTFTDIARIYFPPDEVRQRLAELAADEAAIIRTLPNEPAIHG